MKNEIPTLTLANRDIIDRVNRFYTHNIIVTAVWCLVVFIAIAVFDFSSYLTGEATLIATIAIPLFLLEPYKIIFERGWTGTVKKVVRKDKPYRTFMAIDSSSVLPVIKLIIERTEGTIIVKQYKLKKDQYDYAEALVEYYKTGTVVHCYKGLSYPKKETNIVQINKVTHRLCIVCGNFGDWSHKECQHCKCTFID
jgi:hypothetical protein